MKSARLYHCSRCHIQVFICSRCDRGNIYCGPCCSQESRVQNHRIANRKYQKSLKGKQKHAERQRRYRERKKNNVTDQSSSHLPSNDLLLGEPNEKKSRMESIIHCHFCGEEVSPFLRHGYLRHSSNDQSQSFSSWPLGP